MMSEWVVLAYKGLPGGFRAHWVVYPELSAAVQAADVMQFSGWRVEIRECGRNLRSEDE